MEKSSTSDEVYKKDQADDGSESNVAKRVGYFFMKAGTSGAKTIEGLENDESVAFKGTKFFPAIK